MAVCGLWLLQAAWRMKRNNGWRLSGGWLAITLSVICWAATSHADKGSALGIVFLMTAALVALGWRYIGTDPKPARTPVERLAEHPGSTPAEILRRIFAGLLLGPLVGFAALTLSTAGFVAFRHFGAEHTATLVIAMFAFPLLWAAITVIAAAHSRLWRKSAIVIGAALVPVTYLGLSV